MNIKEEWKPVPEWEDYYLVSNFGRCFSIRKNKIKPLESNNCGYLRLQCYDGRRRKKFFVHRLVAALFVPGYQEGCVVDHIDGDKSNNMFTNLEWVSRSENNKRAYDTGLRVGKREKIPCFIEINGKKLYFNSISDAAKSIGLADKRLHHLIKTQNGYIPEIDSHIFKCVPND